MAGTRPAAPAAKQVRSPPGASAGFRSRSGVNKHRRCSRQRQALVIKIRVAAAHAACRARPPRQALTAIPHSHPAPELPGCPQIRRTPKSAKVEENLTELAGHDAAQVRTWSVYAQL